MVANPNAFILLIIMRLDIVIRRHTRFLQKYQELSKTYNTVVAISSKCCSGVIPIIWSTVIKLSTKEAF